MYLYVVVFSVCILLSSLLSGSYCRLCNRKVPLNSVTSKPTTCALTSFFRRKLRNLNEIMFSGVEVLQQLDGNIWFHVDLLPTTNVMGRLMQPVVNYMSVESGRNTTVIWRNSDEVSRCQLCDAEFSFFNRKHHCRLCGDVFCAACSNNKISINGTLQRVKKFLQYVDLSFVSSNILCFVFVFCLLGLCSMQFYFSTSRCSCYSNPLT